MGLERKHIIVVEAVKQFVRILTDKGELVKLDQIAHRQNSCKSAEKSKSFPHKSPALSELGATRRQTLAQQPVELLEDCSYK